MTFLNGILPPYIESIAITVGIYIVLALGLNLITGVTGQLSLGHAAYMSIGAYSSAVVSMKLGLPFIFSLLIGGCAAGLFGLVIGFPTLRLTGDYLAIATLGFGEIVKSLLFNMAFVGGAMGLAGIPPKTTFTVTLLIVILVVVMMFRVENSRFGRALLAIREDDIAAECSGVDGAAYKIKMFVLGTFIAGLGGALWSHKIMVIQPNDFGFMKSIEILNMVVLGGLGSIPGTILGATVLTSVPELLRFSAEYRMLLYGVILVIMMIFRPNGLLGGVDVTRLVKQSFQTIAGAKTKNENTKKTAKGGN